MNDLFSTVSHFVFAAFARIFPLKFSKEHLGRGWLIRCLAVVCTGGGCGFTPLQSVSEPEPPNILLILSDDHSVPYLGAYGHPDLKTPHLDGLAERGVLFRHAYTTAPQCVPSRASILTGRNVLDVRMSRFSAPLPRDVPTIPEFLDSVGYHTGIRGRHFHLDGSVIQAPQTRDVLRAHDLVTFPERVDYLRTGSDDKVLTQFQAFLDSVPPNAPFFMWMNFGDPHRRFTAEAYAPEASELTVPGGMPDTPEVRKDLAQHYPSQALI